MPRFEFIALIVIACPLFCEFREYLRLAKFPGCKHFPFVTPLYCTILNMSYIFVTVTIAIT